MRRERNTLRLSVIDTVPVDTDQRSADAVQASMRLAETADRAGFTRYWFAEHHNTDSVASTSPAVLAAAVAARTERLRVGSGGVMLPNHAPFVVAEQFAVLEAIAPGRVDLGIGRSTGSDGIVAGLLGSDPALAHRFDDALATVDVLLDPRGATTSTTSGAAVQLRVTPEPSGRPGLWVLGSSVHSAEIAGKLGLPYVYAHHFFESGTEEAIDRYRSSFRESATRLTPEVIVTANVVAAASYEQAFEAALPYLLQLARIETGQTLPRFETVEQAKAIRHGVAPPEVIDRIARRWFIGAPADVHAQLCEFAQSLGVGELMLNLASGRTHAEKRDSVSSRLTTLEQVSRLAFAEELNAAS